MQKKSQQDCELICQQKTLHTHIGNLLTTTLKSSIKRKGMTSTQHTKKILKRYIHFQTFVRGQCRMKRTEAIEWLEVMKENAIFEQYDALKMAIEALSIEPSRKWETCFSCPLAKGCPQIQGKSNAEIAKYASEIPNGCPLSMSHDNDLISRVDAIELCAEAQGRASTKSELKGISKVWQGLLKLPSTDAVSREEYEALKEKWIEAEQRADYYDIDGDDEASGYTLPSTDNTQYEWIVEHSGNGWNDWENLICPKCGEKHERVPYYYNFCPKCGERIGYHKGE